MGHPTPGESKAGFISQQGELIFPYYIRLLQTKLYTKYITISLFAKKVFHYTRRIENSSEIDTLILHFPCIAFWVQHEKFQFLELLSPLKKESV